MIMTRNPRPLPFLVAGSFAAGVLGLASSLRFPEVLLDDPSLSGSLSAVRVVVALASLLGLLASGVLLILLARWFDPRRSTLVWAWAGGLCWVVSALLGLALVVLWTNGIVTGARLVAGIAFGCFAVAAPLTLAVWTIVLVHRLNRGRVSGIIGSVGLLVTFARSVVWAIDVALPVLDGPYVASAVLVVLALLGMPVWLCWLTRLSSTVDSTGLRRLAAGVLAVVVVLGYAALSTAGTPTPTGKGVPSVPSAGGSALYLLMLALSGQAAPPASHQELVLQRQGDRYTRPETPPGATLENLDAGGVPAERICTDGAAADRVMLYLHGGGFVLPPSNGSRRLAAALSRATGACALMPHYRIAPEDPFPAAVRDGVQGYRWLREQGIAATRIVIIGDSAGGTLTLSTALSLRDGGDEPPAALVTVSAATDLTLAGETHKTKVAADPVLGRADVDFSTRSYLGTADPHDPLASPLYADVHGLPPTLLMAGTQETLASDSIRMADRMRNAGVPVEIEIWPGMPHDWPLIIPEIMEADLAIHNIASFVARHVR
jgi:monoterpene epsilon-lactone hydrolase